VWPNQWPATQGAQGGESYVASGRIYLQGDYQDYTVRAITGAARLVAYTNSGYTLLSLDASRSPITVATTELVVDDLFIDNAFAIELCSPKSVFDNAQGLIPECDCATPQGH
jgi:hypothetical protein